MIINIILVTLLVVFAMWTVMTTRLPRSAMGLAITSAVLTIIMFKLNSPLAAVFELSVCAGLISAIFISILSLMRRLSPEERTVRQKEHFYKYWLLPVLIVLTAIALSIIHLPAFTLPVLPAAENDVRTVLWDLRRLDQLGQVVILLTGAFGVIVLFKEWKNER
jgi:NADH-quinone oxidoreductase subunit J